MIEKRKKLNLMAEWSILKEGSNLHDVGIVHSSKKNNGFCLDLDCTGVDDCEERVKSLFDQVLPFFLKDVFGKKCVRPIPAVIGDGRSVDLFNLFLGVRKRGGFDSVSNNGLWSFVAKDCGLDVNLMASIKLIYLKYLDGLDQWLSGMFREKSLRNGESEVVGKLGLLSVELETEFRAMLSSEQKRKCEVGKLVDFKSKKNGEYIDIDSDKSGTNASDSAKNNEVHGNAVIFLSDDDDKFGVINNDDILVSDSTAASELDSRKRRRESSPSMLRMLNWVVEAGKHSVDPAIGKLPDCSEWKKHGNKELWVHALRAREALFVRRHHDSIPEDSSLQKKMKMHPLMYEDSNPLNHQSAEGLRSSNRLPSSPKAHLCPCCNTCSTNQMKPASPREVKVENSPKKQPLVNIEVLNTDGINSFSGDKPLEKHVSIGPLFQAEVPEWIGTLSASDSKWLGTRVWPLEDVKLDTFMKTCPTGKGREDRCGCQFRDSVDCVRFHIAEKRMKLKLELGSVFFRWRFHRMGEEVSLSWKIHEENKFKDMLRSSNPFSANSFKFFHTKKREELVSYYFNVYLVRRRSYQNRVTPKNVDSDDDESEFGSIGPRFGFEAVKIPGTEFLICAQNKQCIEFE